MNRRDVLKATGAAVLTNAFPLGWAPAADDRKKRVLFFTRSQGFQHDCIKRKGSELSHAERVVMQLGDRHGFEVTATKDGRIFLPETLKQFDAFFFFTTGDLTKEGKDDKSPPMPVEGKQAFMQAVADGKGFIGSHCASDTFHSPGKPRENQPPDKIDPFIAMLGGEFVTHGKQQKAWMRVVSPHFPGVKGLKDFQLHEEWYALKNFAPDMHVILAQDGEGMKEKYYHRPLYPATWARRHDKGRVFYTSMGHREDVWTNPTFQQILLGGIAWALGNVDADVTPNIQKVTPQASDLRAEG